MSLCSISLISLIFVGAYNSRIDIVCFKSTIIIYITVQIVLMQAKPLLQPLNVFTMSTIGLLNL